MDTTKRILDHFEQISAIPRGTKREQKISKWLQDWAAGHGLEYQTDDAGNLIIRVPATQGFNPAPVIVLQGHMDMVCEKTPDSPHDFSKDPIRCIVDGDWLYADRTTLGADNGIAIAIGLALAEDDSTPHPPLELLFTVEEEIGIGGASLLNPEMVAGRVLINLDSEEEGVFIVGCAGGRTTRIQLPVVRVKSNKRHEIVSLSVSGLQGGHSGVDIHKHRANANKILARTLDHIQNNIPICLSLISGGTAHNAIPREAEAIFACPKALSTLCREQLALFETTLQKEYAISDPGLKLILVKVDDDELHQVIKPAETARIIQLLMAIPHGVAQMSNMVEGFVETSNNLAVIRLSGSTFHLISSQRSTVMSSLDELTRQIEAVAHLAGTQIENTGGYLAWQPDMDSPLLKKSVDVYEELFHRKPEVKMIHAGLECGIIGEKYPTMDMISLGPTIHDAHSPNERLHIPSVTRVYTLLTDVLKSYQV